MSPDKAALADAVGAAMERLRYHKAEARRHRKAAQSVARWLARCRQQCAAKGIDFPK